MASLEDLVSAINVDTDPVEEVVLKSHETSAGEIIGKVEVPDDESKVMKGGDAAAASDFANYFCSYGFLYHQKQMLTDEHRMQTYHRAVMNNKQLFCGKTIVDVGAGSGILSVWSGQAGASKVWAVEFTDMAKHAVQLVKHNGLAASVTVVKGAVESLDLPPQSVDVMISEWMGYFLLRESMLDSVLRARDRLLKPGGVMMPSAATMYWCPVECEEDRQAKEEEMKESMVDWQQFVDTTAAGFGVDFGCLTPGYRKEQRDYFSLSSQWTELPGEAVVGEPAAIKRLDLHTCTMAECLGVEETPFEFAMPPEARTISAFAGWFEADFCGSPANPAPDPCVLSTHPKMGYTHWGQQVFYLLDPLEVKPGDTLRGTIKMFRTEENTRLYHVGLSYAVTHADGSQTATVKATYEMP